MTLATIVFWFFVVTAFASALGILLSRNVFKAALLLLACLLSVAALFVFSFAEFVAVTQIIIYGGGATVLIIFGIMLTSKLAGKPLEVKNGNVFSGTLMAIGMLFIISNSLYNGSVEPLSSEMKPAPIQKIGTELMTSFSLPFELAGILLLLALVAAGVFTSFLKEKKW
ncbi:MAG TPA: NADH-quinone oxidoreductase subunit J [Chryseosolibacter sp.]|nr:NADH-quinone oxidoreductase subunit J [Chryseosolibacter sp.]